MKKPSPKPLSKSSSKARPTAGFKQLRAIQRAFATGIMRPLTPDQRMQPGWIDEKSTHEAVAKFIKPNDRLDAFERLEIYNRQYWFRLIDCFYEDFPALRSLIGEKRFYDLTIAYLTKYPSDSFTLRDLGNRLEAFLVEEPHWVEKHPLLARDLVRLEWAHIVAFDGEELPPLEIDALLDGADPSTLRLHFQPYLTFLACEYPVDDYILAIRRREEPQGGASNAVSESTRKRASRKIIRPKAAKNCLAIHRSENAVYYKRLEPAAYRICAALREGLPLQAACEQAVTDEMPDKNFGVKLQGWFAQWASFGWFCRPDEPTRLS